MVKDKLINNPNYEYIGINTMKKKREILNILGCIKEIRDTAYPLKGSNVTELKIDNFVARREKDLILISGDLSLEDNNKYEKRNFEAYVMYIDDKNIHVYMDIVREGVSEEPKVIRTTEEINLEKKVTIITKYNFFEGTKEKIYTVKLSEEEYLNFLNRHLVEQLSVL